MKNTPRKPNNLEQIEESEIENDQNLLNKQPENLE